MRYLLSFTHVGIECMREAIGKGQGVLCMDVVVFFLLKQQ